MFWLDTRIITQERNVQHHTELKKKSQIRQSPKRNCQWEDFPNSQIWKISAQSHIQWQKHGQVLGFLKGFNLNPLWKRSPVLQCSTYNPQRFLVSQRGSTGKSLWKVKTSVVKLHIWSSKVIWIVKGSLLPKVVVLKSLYETEDLYYRVPCRILKSSLGS